MRRGDPVDAAHLDEVVRSAGFARIRERCAAMVAVKMRELVRPLSEAETAAARGFIAGVEACLRVPDILKEELAACRRRQSRR